MAMPENVLPVTWSEKYYPSLYSLCVNIQELQKAMDNIPLDLIDRRPRDLEKEIRKLNGGTFDRTLGFIKIKFWDEYRRCMADKTTMKLENVMHGICSHFWFRKHVLASPVYMAWLIQPPTDVTLYQQEIINKSFAKISDALDQPLIEVRYVQRTNAKGEKISVQEKRLNVPFLKEVHAILKTMQDRQYGAIVHRAQIESKSITARMDVPPQGGGLSLSDPNLTMEQLEAFQKKIKKLKGDIASIAPEVLEGAEYMDEEGREVEDPPEGESPPDT